MATSRKAAVVDVLRFVFLSPEFLCVILASVSRWLWPWPLTQIGDAIVASTDFGKGATGVFPVALLATNAGLAYKVLFPSNKNRVLVSWPDYPKLRRRVAFSVGVTAIALLGCVIAAGYAKSISPLNLGHLVAALLTASAASTLTMLYASLQIREIVEHLKKDE